MALPEKLASALAALAEYVSEDEEQVAERAKEVATELRKKDGDHAESLRPIAQLLLNAGAGKKSGETGQKVKDFQKQIDTLTEERDGLSEQLDGLNAKPNEQQAAWDKERDKLIKRAEKAETERDTERTGRQQETVTSAKTSFLSHLRGRVDDFGLKAIDRMYGDRFRPKEGGGVEVLDEDGEVIEPPKGKTAEELLAESAFATVPDSNRLRDLKPGGGVNGRGGQGSPTVEQIAQEKLATREFGARF